VPQNRILSLSQPAQSVFLLSMPKTVPTYQIVIGASDDAMVKAGANGDANFGASPNLYAKNEPVNPAARNVTFVKFDTGSVVASEIEQAILQVYGENTGTDGQVIAHVYGITNDAWNEASINWNNAPNLADSLGTAVDNISENIIEGIGTSATFVGNLTGVAAPRPMSIDVTRFVREHPDQEITFLIAREVRFDGENVDDDLTSLRLASKERGTEPGPQLLLALSDFALAGDYDHSGTVDSADYGVWKGSIGSGASLTADGNRNGQVDSADYIIWRKNIGKSLPGTVWSAAATTAVPEPSAALLAWLGFLSICWQQSAR